MREANVADVPRETWSERTDRGKAGRILRNAFPACLLDGTLVLVRIFTILLWNFTIKCVILSNAPASAGFGRFGGDLQIKR